MVCSEASTELSRSCAQMCNPSAQLQAKRNEEENRSELSRLNSCPECKSSNYDEEIV